MTNKPAKPPVSPPLDDGVVFDDDNPEWREEDFARAEKFDPPITLAELAERHRAERALKES